MKVTVLLFASVADAVGKRRLDVETGEGARVVDVRDRLLEQYPVLERYAPNLMYAVDEDYAELETPVRDGATLALIPPVSGGSTCLRGSAIRAMPAATGGRGYNGPGGDNGCFE